MSILQNDIWICVCKENKLRSTFKKFKMVIFTLRGSILKSRIELFFSVASLEFSIHGFPNSDLTNTEIEITHYFYGRSLTESG